MLFYLAPMEGITGCIVRNAFFHHFSNIDKFYTPFIPAAKRMNKKILRDIDPENNRGICLVPQVMSNRADEVIDLGNQLKEFGYDFLNINLGCPSGTVVGKKRGSGLLYYPEELDLFLDELYKRTDMKVSIKTRIGFNSPDEWQKILEVYRKYPIAELIVHPRIQKDFYKNTPRLEAFFLAEEILKDTGIPLCYNGDIVDEDSYRRIKEKFPSLGQVMIGRGFLARPYLAEQLAALEETDLPAGGSSVQGGGKNGMKDSLKLRLKAFHDEIFEGYCSVFSGEKDAMFHMKEIWCYLGDSFAGSEKYVKKIKKAKTIAEYQAAAAAVFGELEIASQN